jgi:PAS domain S-box-containing protein
MAAAFDAAPIAAAVVRLSDHERPRFADVNAAFRTLLGAEAQRALALPVDEVLHGFGELVVAVSTNDGTGTAVGSCRDAAGVTAPALLHGARLGVDHDGSTLIMVQLTEIGRAGQFERALRESEKRAQDLVDNVKALVYIKSAEGGYLLVNRHFEEMYGVSRRDTSRRKNSDFFPPEIAEVYSANDRRVLETGVPEQFEEPREGGGAWLSLKFPLFDVDGRIYAVGGISTDITDRSRAEALIRQAKDEAEKANQAKSEFLSRISHELRTPLNSILGFGQLLQLEQLPRSTRENVDRIVKAGRHLLALINEVLEISRIEAMESIDSVEPLDISRPLIEAIELVRPLADERSIEISQDLHGGMFRFVAADRQRLTQVLLNILSNAIKYNRIGGRVRIFFREPDRQRLRLCVADTGYGMTPEEIPKSFLPFERLGADRTATEGTGLGLTLSRGLIQAMGGELGVEESTPDIGTTFYIELPLVEADSAAMDDLAVLPEQQSLEGLAVRGGTVVYIEDNLSNLDLVYGLLSHVSNVRLIPAVQGQLGIELSAQHQPDLILLDLHLPDLDGEAVLTRLRHDERTRDIPVVVLSADATHERIRRLRELGAAAYVTKPIDVPDFLGVVQRVLDPSPAHEARGGA